MQIVLLQHVHFTTWPLGLYTPYLTCTIYVYGGLFRKVFMFNLHKTCYTCPGLVFDTNSMVVPVLESD
jgi:hypothetical protein